MDAVVVALRTGTESAVGGPPTLANPLLDLFEVSMTRRAQIVEMRNTSIAKYAFAIPTVQALDRIRECSPGGVVEIGAGTGYWAHAFHQRGVDVEAYDIEPAPSLRNAWFAGTPPWYRVQRRDDGVAGEHPGRTLLIVWPTKNEIWAAAAVERYFEAGGMCVVHVGEGPGGRTGDDVFHALLGELVTCAQCAYGSTTSPCICDVTAQWCRTETIVLPHWRATTTTFTSTRHDPRHPRRGSVDSRDYADLGPDGVSGAPPARRDQLVMTNRQGEQDARTSAPNDVVAPVTVAPERQIYG